MDSITCVRSGDYDRPQRRTKAKPSIIFCVGDRRKSKKNPRRTQLACHRTAHIGHGQHVQWNPTVSKHEAHTMNTSPTVRCTNNTLVFLIRVGSLASSFASTWPAMSVADPRASPVAVVKRCGKSFPIIIGSYAPCAAAAWPQTYRGTAGGPPEKIHCDRTEQERRLLFALPWWYQAIALSIDATIQMNTHRASAAAPRPKGAANEPTWWRKETHEAKIKLRTRTVTASTSTSSLVHQQKLAAVFTFLELEVGERLDDQATVSSKWPLSVVEISRWRRAFYF